MPLLHPAATTTCCVPRSALFLATAILLQLITCIGGFTPLRHGPARPPVHYYDRKRSSKINVVSWNSNNIQKELPRSAAAALTILSTSASSSAATTTLPLPSGGVEIQPMSKFAKKLTKIGAIAFIATVALGLITSLSLIKLLGYLGIIKEETRRQKWALSTGQFCARWALRLFPFCKLEVITDKDDGNDDSMKNPQPAIWVCNHTSMMDVFLLLAADRKMRGPKKRPIKVVYWKQLESNPFCKILFRQSGFIPINMAANKPGEDNEYDKSSFKSFLKESKQAFVDGFDIGVLPEGQLNPSPEKGLMPLFSGAHTLARMSRRPIQMMALHGVNQLWHPDDGLGVGDMNITGRHVKIRVYPTPRKYESDEDFKKTFSEVVGHFGKFGTDVVDYKEWLDGTKWNEIERERKREPEAKAAEEQQLVELRARQQLLEQRLRDEKAAREKKDEGEKQEAEEIE